MAACHCNGLTDNDVAETVEKIGKRILYAVTKGMSFLATDVAVYAKIFFFFFKQF